MGDWPNSSHWLIILLAVVLLFGTKGISEFTKGLGRGVKTFKDEMNNEDEAVKNAHKIEEKQDTTSRANTDANIDEVRKS